MITFEKFQLCNGLRVLAHYDTSTPIAAMNLLYHVGAKDENEHMTGFAHLFEHLMFGGSLHIPVFDEPLEMAGGENNAFTNNDITDYYLSLPANNIETAFWLESDRMLSLDFSQQKLDIQRNVVIEEYKQHYLNQPYGNVWLLLRPLVYKVHPYRWSTIGKDISHIEHARLENVRSFFFNFYGPANAILTVSGNVKPDKVWQLAEKWFGPIENRSVNRNHIPAEPKQEMERILEYRADVPYDAIYKAYHMYARSHSSYYVVDLLTDILSNGKSSRLYISLVKEKKLFSEINAYVSGDLHEGMLVVSGKLIKGVDIVAAEKGIEQVINGLQLEPVPADELQKVKNKVESILQFSNSKVLDKAINLSFAELLGNANLINTEIYYYQAVTAEQIRNEAREILSRNNCSTLYYLSNE